MCRAPGPRDARRGRLLLLRCVLAAASRQQVVHASSGKRRQLGASRTSHYDVLQLTPKATQAQVKDAYYKLSKKYHPDQYRGDEDPAKKFREIKEAYEVLGNFHQRKMYDRGMLGVTPAATPAEAEEYSTKFYESRQKKRHVPTGTGRTPIYNFDEWSRTHYESTRLRRENTKVRYEQVLRDRVEDVEEKKTQSVISLLTLSGIMMIIYYIITLDNDKPKKNLKKGDSSNISGR